MVRRGEDALARTPQYLEILRQAGVVDAGGAGLLELVRGVTAGLTGEALPALPAELEHVGLDAVHQELSKYRYCTVFVVEGEGLDLDGLEDELEKLGDSLMVVGDPSALKVHVHTDDPGAALSLGAAQGVLEGIEIANMHRQTEERETRCSSSSIARDRGGRGRRRRRERAALPRPRRDAGRRGRPVDEPVDRRHPRRDRGDDGAGA